MVIERNFRNRKIIWISGLVDTNWGSVQEGRGLTMEKLCILHFFAIHQSWTCPNAVIYPRCGTWLGPYWATIAPAQILRETFHMLIFFNFPQKLQWFLCPKQITTMHFNDLNCAVFSFLAPFQHNFRKMGLCKCNLSIQTSKSSRASQQTCATECQHSEWYISRLSVKNSTDAKVQFQDRQSKKS